MLEILMIIVAVVAAALGAVASGGFVRWAGRPRWKGSGVACHASTALSQRLDALLSTLPGCPWSAAFAAAPARHGPLPAAAMAVAGARSDPRQLYSPITKT